MFNNLGLEEIKQVIGLQIDNLGARLGEQEISINLNQEVIEWLAKIGYDPNYGARPLKRTIQRELETPIAKGILSGRYKRGGFIEVELNSNQLKFK